MGIKLWQLEKLSRVVNSMFDVPNETQAQISNAARSRGVAAVRGEREPELSRMLLNERLNGPSDRDPTVALSEIIPFRGPFIYIRDIDERTKPIMVRDYPRPTIQEEGEWPQFRSARHGRCPFVEDISRHELEAETRLRAEEQALAKAETRTAPRTRAATIREDADASAAATAASQKRPLEEKRNPPNAFNPPPIKMPKMPTHDFCPPPIKARSPTKAARDAICNAGPRLFGGEPAASGLQQSNITSAIRSQMISSTAAAPGAKAGTSKEVHGLKRKVLEKNTRPPLNSIQTRQRSIDPAGTARAEKNIPMARQNRRQAPEPLIHIDEESTQSEEDEDARLGADSRGREKQLEKGEKEKESKESKGKDLKEGYCENCRKKYDHFDDVSSLNPTTRDNTDDTTQHVVSHQHRKFALTDSNWTDLDKLLAHLGRRLKEPDSDGF